MKATLLPPGVVQGFPESRSRVALLAGPEVPVPWAKNKRCPTMESTERYVQITVGVVLLSQAIHTVPPSWGMFAERGSIPCADPVQKLVPQRAVLPRVGSAETAAIAALGKIAEEPTAITLQLMVEPAD